MSSIDTRCTRVFVYVLCLITTAACHRYESVADIRAVVGTRGRVTLSPEGRANNARRLGGVAMDITGVVLAAPGDSVAIRADEVRFADLGTVPFAQGELRFAAVDVLSLAKEVTSRRKTVVASAIAAIGVLIAAELFTPNTTVLGFGKRGTPQAR